ncbi:hypothetical protein AB0M50_33740 [Nonomuraea fuscirosea]|uniref:hypothetical protein n=1 Tax=Nonomuraea fuscirosea TaxID=1291556 RepID=UPI00343A00F8
MTRSGSQHDSGEDGVGDEDFAEVVRLEGQGLSAGVDDAGIRRSILSDWRIVAMEIALFSPPTDHW